MPVQLSRLCCQKVLVYSTPSDEASFEKLLELSQIWTVIPGRAARQVTARKSAKTTRLKSR